MSTAQKIIQSIDHIIKDFTMLGWIPMTNEDWEWVNYGTLPKNS